MRMINVIKKVTCGLLLAVALAVGSLAPAAAQAYIGVRLGPPPPMYERVPPPPRPGVVWRRGYWHWDGHRYVWVQGVYVRRPYADARWVPEHYVRTAYGWRRVPGHWVG